MKRLECRCFLHVECWNNLLTVFKQHEYVKLVLTISLLFSETNCLKCGKLAFPMDILSGPGASSTFIPQTNVYVFLTV